MNDNYDIEDITSNDAEDASDTVDDSCDSSNEVSDEAVGGEATESTEGLDADTSDFMSDFADENDEDFASDVAVDIGIEYTAESEDTVDESEVEEMEIGVEIEDSDDTDIDDELEVEIGLGIEELNDINDDLELEEEEIALDTEYLVDPEIDIGEEPLIRSLHDDLTDSDLFNKNDYTYGETEYGKYAYGVLKDENGERNLSDQKNLPGKLPLDDSGHLIATRFDGSGSMENLVPMERNLNRSSYKARENSWAASLDNGDKILVSVESFDAEGNDRPNAIMGYTITEHPDGTRDWDVFSYQNESRQVQAAQNEELYLQNDLIDEYENLITYDPGEFEDELSS